MDGNNPTAAPCPICGPDCGCNSEEGREFERMVEVISRLEAALQHYADHDNWDKPEAMHSNVTDWYVAEVKHKYVDGWHVAEEALKPNDEE